MCSAASDTSEVPTRNRSSRRGRASRPARGRRGRSRSRRAPARARAPAASSAGSRWFEQLRKRVLHDRQVQPDEVAVEVGEARARRARAAFHVDQRAREREVVARLEAELGLRSAHGDGDRVLLRHAVGGRRMRDVRELEQQLVELRRDARRAAPRAPPGASRPAALRLLLARRPRRPSCAADRLGGAVALGSHCVDLALQRSGAARRARRIASSGPGRRVDARASAVADALGVGAEQAEVEHAAMLAVAHEPCEQRRALPGTARRRRRSTAGTTASARASRRALALATRDAERRPSRAARGRSRRRRTRPSLRGVKPSRSRDEVERRALRHARAPRTRGRSAATSR